MTDIANPEVPPPMTVAPPTTVGGAIDLATRLLEASGVPHARAVVTATAIVQAEVWRLGSHGLMRLPYYLQRLSAGGCRADAELTTVVDTGALISLDGGGGLGHWQLWEAAQVAANRCAEHGIAAVAVGDSSHCGALGVYLLPLLRNGLAGMVFSNGPAVMPPWGGATTVVSTSPLAFGFPTGDGIAIVDLASSAVARGKIAQLAAAGKSVPAGWALDAAGQPTTDSRAALTGMLAPLGGAKGFALAFAVEALTGGLVGPTLATDVADMFAGDQAASRQGISHLVIALDPARLSPSGNAIARLDDLTDKVREAGGRVPGSGRVDIRDIASETSLAVDPRVAAELAEWADRLAVMPNDAP